MIRGGRGLVCKFLPTSRIIILMLELFNASIGPIIEIRIGERRLAVLGWISSCIAL